MSDRQPILGTNAKAFFAQLAIGVAVAVGFALLVKPWLSPIIGQMICFYVTGSCS